LAFFQQAGITEQERSFKDGGGLFLDLEENFGNQIYFCKLLCASRMHAGTLAILLVQVSCQILEQDG